MVSDFQLRNLDVLKRFNRSFPDFYEQFVGRDVQLQNLKLGFQIHRTNQAVIQIHPEGDRSVLHFAHRNHSYLLSDLFGVMAAYKLTIHNVSLYGHVRPPMLVFVKLVLSEQGKPLTKKRSESVRRALQQTLSGEFAVEEMLAMEFNVNEGLPQITTSFYQDQVFHLPALLVESANHPALLYKVMHAIWQEELLVVNVNFMLWQGRVRLLLYLLGPNGSVIPDYLGSRIAAKIKDHLTGNTALF